MKIAICDDEHRSLEYITAQVGSSGINCDIVPFLNATDMLQKIKDGEVFDAVLMDIEWYGEQKGIDFAVELNKSSPKTKIIFITGYPERYSQQIFLKNTNLKGFISKPVNTEILYKSLEKIRSEIISEENRKLLLKFNGVIVGVDPDDILYIESRSHTITAYTINGEYPCYDKLNALVKRLPGNFIFTHKSFLVNMDKIRRVERERILLEKSIEIPISKSQQNEVRESYFRYIGSSI